MKIGYRILKGIIKFYGEDRKVYMYSNLGNKRIKPEKIFRFRYRQSTIIISKRHYDELKEEMEWFEIK